MTEPTHISETIADYFRRITGQNIEHESPLPSCRGGDCTCALCEGFATNDTHIGRAYSSGFVPFALCQTRGQAVATCENMKCKQELLAAFAGDSDDGRDNCCGGDCQDGAG